MADDDAQDIFGKIDAMLGRRGGFAGGAAKAEDEFPVLTDVVAQDARENGQRLSPATDAMATPAAPAADSSAVEPEAPGQLSEVDIDRLAAALEARLSELFIRQQLRVESLVRRVVREELDARRN